MPRRASSYSWCSGTAKGEPGAVNDKCHVVVRASSSPRAQEHAPQQARCRPLCRCNRRWGMQENAPRLPSSTAAQRLGGRWQVQVQACGRVEVGGHGNPWLRSLATAARTKAPRQRGMVKREPSCCHGVVARRRAVYRLLATAVPAVCAALMCLQNQAVSTPGACLGVVARRAARCQTETHSVKQSPSQMLRQHDMKMRVCSRYARCSMRPTN